MYFLNSVRAYAVLCPVHSSIAGIVVEQHRHSRFEDSESPYTEYYYFVRLLSLGTVPYGRDGRADKRQAKNRGR